MAWRGRGRGRPGGWARHDITLKEDEELSDVPQTYPPARMPAKAPSEGSLDAETKRLLIRFQRMRKAFHNSLFYMNEPAKEELHGCRPDVRRYLDQDPVATSQNHRIALSQVVRLHKMYTPSELYSAKDARASLRQQAMPIAAAPLHHRREGDELGSTQMLPDSDGQGGDDGKEQAADSDREDDEREDEDADDDLDLENDDYYQGERFDDDEEYGQEDDDGDGEAYY